MIIIFFVGLGVFSTVDIPKGAFLLEYAGDLLSEEEGTRQEEIAKQMKLGCFIFFFSFDRKNYW